MTKQISLGLEIIGLVKHFSNLSLYNVNALGAAECCVKSKLNGALRVLK